MKKNYRPAQIVLDHSIHRRSSQQVKADQAEAKAKAAAAEAAAKAHEESQREQVAALEDAQQVEEYARSLEDLRPDLHISRKSASNTDVETLSDSHLTLDDPVEIPREPLIDIPRLLPLEQGSYRSSGPSDDFLTGWLGEDAAVGERNHEEQDQEFVMHTQAQDNNDSEASEVSEASQALRDQTRKPRPKAKFKPQRDIVCFLFSLVPNTF